MVSFIKTIKSNYLRTSDILNYDYEREKNDFYETLPFFQEPFSRSNNHAIYRVGHAWSQILLKFSGCIHNHPKNNSSMFRSLKFACCHGNQQRRIWAKMTKTSVKIDSFYTFIYPLTHIFGFLSLFAEALWLNRGSLNLNQTQYDIWSSHTG